MSSMENFGVIIACYYKDYCFAKGCCASVRYFLGDVPIAIIVDGDFPITELEKLYGVQIINRHTITHQELTKYCFGSPYTKMLPLWESPWEYFLYLDSDTVVWGDVLKLVPDLKNYDMILDDPGYGYTEDAISRWFFNVPKIKHYFPDYQWQDRPYACAGVYFGKRGTFSLEEYIELMELSLADPAIFPMIDQGMLNFMGFRAADEGRIQLGCKNFQLIVPDYEPEAFKKRFQVKQDGPVFQTNDEPAVIHWSGWKPLMLRSAVGPAPMNFFRRKVMQEARGFNGLATELALQVEDYNFYKTKWRRWLKNKLIPA